MREIIFRGKSVETGEWVEGNLIHRTEFYGDPVDDYHILRIGEFHCDYYDSEEVIPETIGQKTGLIDEDGKDIFEGDIVEYEAHGYMPMIEQGEVVFNNGCFGIKCYLEYLNSEYIHQIGKTTEWQDMGASGTITYTYKVIGNVHDNPELLKGEEK